MFWYDSRYKWIKDLIKHISCKCKCKFDGGKCKSNQKWNKNECRCECKNPKKDRVCEKYYIWNSATCNCENGKYLASTIDDSVITCNEIINSTKTVPIKVIQKIYIFYSHFY